MTKISNGNLAIKISRVIGVLNKLKHIFPQHILLTIYNSLTQPHLIYGLYIWGLNCKRLKILQKKAVRILAFKNHTYHTLRKYLRTYKYYSWRIFTLCNYINFITKTQITYYRHTLVALHHFTIIMIITSGITY